jgi:hypothetical protein
MKKHISRNDAAAVCRWLARIVGTLLVILAVYIAIGQGMPDPFTQPTGVQVGFLALAFIFIGILAGSRWELSGGIILLFGWCLFLVSVINSPRGLTGLVIALAAPGALWVTSALLRRYYENHLSA